VFRRAHPVAHLWVAVAQVGVAVLPHLHLHHHPAHWVVPVLQAVVPQVHDQVHHRAHRLQAVEVLVALVLQVVCHPVAHSLLHQAVHQVLQDRRALQAVAHLVQAVPVLGQVHHRVVHQALVQVAAVVPDHPLVHQVAIVHLRPALVAHRQDRAHHHPQAHRVAAPCPAAVYLVALRVH